MFAGLETRLPPLAVVVVSMFGMWLVSGAVPDLELAWPWRHSLVIVLSVIGTCIAVAGLIELRRARTTVNPLRPQAASAMVASGIYRRTRNPMYLGMLLVMAGWAVYLSHALAWVFVPVFVAYMNRFQIAPEEKALRDRFGDAYVRYARLVRRWL